MAYSTSFDWTVAVDLRNHMMPESVSYANQVSYLGIIATILGLSEPCDFTLGFVQQFGDCFVDGVQFSEDDFSGTIPARYLELNLTKGDHLIVMDTSGTTHGLPFSMDVHCKDTFEIVSNSPFISIGPFDQEEIIDHLPLRKLNDKHIVYSKILENGLIDVPNLFQFQQWIKPISPESISGDDPFILSVWKKQHYFLTIPVTFQRSIIFN